MFRPDGVIQDAAGILATVISLNVIDLFARDDDALTPLPPRRPSVRFDDARRRKGG